MAWAGGQEAALTQLHRWLQQARRGSRQTVVVTGESALDKTTRLEILLGEIGSELAFMGLSQAEVEAYRVERYRNDALATA